MCGGEGEGMKPVTEGIADVTQLKKRLRQSILDVRDNISVADKACYDARIRENVCNTDEYRRAQVILAYANYRSEVGTEALTRQALSEGKYVFMPKVSGDEMEFWQIAAMEDLQEGYRGIPEPVESISLPDWVMGNDNGFVYRAMMWMPGAVFDKERHRIGYGKGFYDRYLDRFADLMGKGCGWQGKLQLTTAALAYSCQVIEKIPCEPHDIRPDLVITEEGT